MEDSSLRKARHAREIIENFREVGFEFELIPREYEPIENDLIEKDGCKHLKCRPDIIDKDSYTIVDVPRYVDLDRGYTEDQTYCRSRDDRHFFPDNCTLMNERGIADVRKMYEEMAARIPAPQKPSLWARLFGDDNE